VLQSCWHTSPEQRPTFAELSAQLQLAGRQSHAAPAPPTPLPLLLPTVVPSEPVPLLAEASDAPANDGVELQTFATRGPRVLSGYATFDDIAI
jgi:hypothetical protein